MTILDLTARPAAIRVTTLPLFATELVLGQSIYDDPNAPFDANWQTHRTIALTSIGLATTSYLMMLFGNH